MSELQLRRKCCWQVFTDIEYKSEQEHLGISNFFSDLEVLKEALTDKRRQQSNKRTETLRRAGRLDEEAMKITTMYQESHGEHAISSRTEDKLFDRPNAPTHLSLQVRARRLRCGTRPLAEGGGSRHACNVRPCTLGRPARVGAVYALPLWCCGRAQAGAVGGHRPHPPRWAFAPPAH